MGVYTKHSIQMISGRPAPILSDKRTDSRGLVNQHRFYVASNPGFLFRILSRSFGKIRNGKPGFEARFYVSFKTW